MTLQSLIERVNYAVLFWCSVAALATAVAGWWLGRACSKAPGPRQAAAEILVLRLDAICRRSHGGRADARCMAAIGGLALAAIVSNVLGVMPLRYVGLGLLPQAGIEIGGGAYRDFDNNGIWDAGEPVVRDAVTDWKLGRHARGFLVPSVLEPTTGANILIELSLCLVACVALLVGIPLWLARARRLAEGRRWHAYPGAALRAVPQAMVSTAELAVTPLGGILGAIAVGGVAYNLFHACGVVFMSELGAGLIEGFVVAWALAHSRARAARGDAAGAAAA